MSNDVQICRKKKLSPEVICTAIITLSITAGVGMLTFDYVNGAEVIVTSIDIDEWNAPMSCGMPKKE